ncbi:hypothetical protein LCGC14_0694360 [marine sediment metagenome]|uniref:Uncharacterized protein n=1 Tax=marine sediment metagenome TaxID=412755 RepID=A0A0F9QPJ7_9ZZZZ
MNKEEFAQIFEKTVFIEHLTKKQQEEFYEVVKGLVLKRKVRKVLEQYHRFITWRGLTEDDYNKMLKGLELR